MNPRPPLTLSTHLEGTTVVRWVLWLSYVGGIGEPVSSGRAHTAALESEAIRGVTYA